MFVIKGKIKKKTSRNFFIMEKPTSKKWMDFSLGFPQSHTVGGRAHPKTVSFLLHSL